MTNKDLFKGTTYNSLEAGTAGSHYQKYENSTK